MIWLIVGLFFQLQTVYLLISEKNMYIPVRGNRASRMPGTDIPETGNLYFYSINDLSRP